MSALDQRKGVYEPRRETLKDIPLAGTEEDRYRRSELLKKRKARLIEFARRSSDDATVKVCIAYLQTYFGGGRKMIFELCKYRLIWNARGWRLFYDELAERFYPPKTKVYLGRESNERLKKS